MKHPQSHFPFLSLTSRNQEKSCPNLASLSIFVSRAAPWNAQGSMCEPSCGPIGV